MPAYFLFFLAVLGTAILLYTSALCTAALLAACIVKNHVLRLSMVACIVVAPAVHAQRPPPGWVPPPPPPVGSDKTVIGVDVSASMKSVGGMEQIIPAIRGAFLDGSGRDLPFEAQLMTFGNRARIVVGFTHRQADLSSALDQLRFIRLDEPESHLVDAILLAAAQLRASGTGAKRVVIVTDGADVDGADVASRLMQVLRAEPKVVVDVLLVARTSKPTTAALTLANVVKSSGGRILMVRPADVLAQAGNVLKPQLSVGAAPPPSGESRPPSSGPALHTARATVRAATELKCLQLAYGVAAGVLQDVNASTTAVTGHSGDFNVSISSQAVGAGQNAVALVTTAGGSNQSATALSESIAIKLAAAVN